MTKLSNFSHHESAQGDASVFTSPEEDAYHQESERCSGNKFDSAAKHLPKYEQSCRELCDRF